MHLNAIYKTPETGNKMFVLLWIVSYIGVSLSSLMPLAATSLVASVNSVKLGHRD